MLNKIWMKIIVGVIVAGILTGGIFYYQYRMALKNTADKEISQLLARVSKLIILPHEIPTVATVTDMTKLESQKFFKNSLNGDKVLIYPLAFKAVLYRPSKNIIVEVASVQSGDTVGLQAQNTVSPEVKKYYKVALLNGSSVAGAADKLKKNIKGDNLEIVTDKAESRDYLRTIIINVGNVDDEVVTQLAENTGAKVMNSLPVVETVSGYDVVIIVGKDKL